MEYGKVSLFVLPVFGFFLTWLAIHVFAKALSLHLKGERTTGFFDRWKYSKPRLTSLRAPVVLFEDKQSHLYEAVGLSKSYRGHKMYDPPKKLEYSVIYDSDNPQISAIDSFLHLWFSPLCLFAFALVPLVAATFCWIDHLSN